VLKIFDDGNDEHHLLASRPIKWDRAGAVGQLPIGSVLKIQTVRVLWENEERVCVRRGMVPRRIGG